MKSPRQVFSLGFSLLLLVAAAGACRRGPDDAALTAAVRAKLGADPQLAAQVINVETKEGVVTLGGTVTAQGDRTSAESLARGVEGVKSVTNNLTVRAPVAVATPVINPDTQLRSAVEANFTKYNLSGITADVAEGVVTLKGTITRAKLQDAIKAANEAKPKKVNNQLTIK
jgi:osmotically-inducible protein OsmY